MTKNLSAYIDAVKNQTVEKEVEGDGKMVADFFAQLKPDPKLVTLVFVAFFQWLTCVFLQNDMGESAEEKVSHEEKPVEEGVEKVKEPEVDPKTEEASVAVESARPPTPENPDLQGPLPGSGRVYQLNLDHQHLLDAPLRLFHQLTGDTTTKSELVTALTTMGFTKLRASFPSKNKFLVWLKLVMMTEIVDSDQLWVREFFTDDSDRRIYNNCLAKCKNQKVERCEHWIRKELGKVV